MSENDLPIFSGTIADEDKHNFGACDAFYVVNLGGSFVADDVYR
jgi:hypothetical protein